MYQGDVLRDGGAASRDDLERQPGLFGQLAPRRVVGLLAGEPRAGRRRPSPLAFVCRPAGREPMQEEKLPAARSLAPDDDTRGERRLGRHGQAVPGGVHGSGP